VHPVQRLAGHGPLERVDAQREIARDPARVPDTVDAMRARRRSSMMRPHPGPVARVPQ
jgi:hypothetical protein